MTMTRLLAVLLLLLLSTPAHAASKLPAQRAAASARLQQAGVDKALADATAAKLTGALAVKLAAVPVPPPQVVTVPAAPQPPDPPSLSRLTAQEQQNVYALLSCGSNHRAALVKVAEVLAMPGGITAESRGPVVASLKWLEQAEWELHQTLGHLLDARPKRTVEEIVAYNKLTREQVKTQYILPHFARAKMFQGSASGALDTALAVNTGHAGYQDNILRAKRDWLSAAVNDCGRFNTSLPYANPHTVFYPLIVGPHGDEWQAQYNKWFAIKYGHDWAQNVIDGIAADAEILPFYSPIAQTLVQTFALWTHQTQALMLDAGLLLDWPQHPMNVAWKLPPQPQPRPPSFYRALLAQELLMMDAAQTYHRVQDGITNGLALMTLQPSALGMRGKLVEATVRLTDSWKHNDEAIWMALCFPKLNECLGAIGAVPSSTPGPALAVRRAVPRRALGETPLRTHRPSVAP